VVSVHGVLDGRGVEEVIDERGTDGAEDGEDDPHQGGHGFAGGGPDAQAHEAPDDGDGATEIAGRRLKEEVVEFFEVGPGHGRQRRGGNHDQTHNQQEESKVTGRHDVTHWLKVEVSVSAERFRSSHKFRHDGSAVVPSASSRRSCNSNGLWRRRTDGPGRDRCSGRTPSPRGRDEMPIERSSPCRRGGR